MNHWRKLTLAFATFVILLGPMSGTASLRVAAAPLRAQPALAQLAAEMPDSLVAVIVQKADASGAAEAQRLARTTSDANSVARMARADK